MGKVTFKKYTLFNHAFIVQKCASSFPMDLINKVLLDANLIVIQSSFEHITLVVMLKKCQNDSFIENETVQGFVILVYLSHL